MSVVTPFPTKWDRRPIATFDRKELMKILDLYGRMVASGHWRDYALRIDPDVAIFAAYRRHSERPEVRIEKRPELRLKQGAFALVGEHGAVLKRGQELAPSGGTARSDATIHINVAVVLMIVSACGSESASSCWLRRRRMIAIA